MPFDIERFAHNYLGLNIEYKKLSDTGDVLGLTAYGGMELVLDFSGSPVCVTVPDDTVMLDDKLMTPQSLHRRRFTIAHECAHQILARIEERKTGHSFRKALVSGRKYSFRDLHSVDDWGEWQANSLAAALLIPKSALTMELNEWDKPFKPVLYGYWFSRNDYRQMKNLGDSFCVSMSAMKKRLSDLDSLIVKTVYDYVDPYGTLGNWGGGI
jgi:hypothetical protein